MALWSGRECDKLRKEYGLPVCRTITVARTNKYRWIGCKWWFPGLKNNTCAARGGANNQLVNANHFGAFVEIVNDWGLLSSYHIRTRDVFRRSALMWVFSYKFSFPCIFLRMQGCAYLSEVLLVRDLQNVLHLGTSMQVMKSKMWPLRNL